MNQPEPRADGFDVVELRIPCKPEYVALARLTVAAIASRLDYSLEEIEDVKLAVAEACTNAIQHATHSEFINLTCETGLKSLRIRVRDFGRGTRLEQIHARDLEETRAGGLGVFLIRELMDEVTYDVHPERGTDLVMVKKRQR